MLAKEFHVFNCVGLCVCVFVCVVVCTVRIMNIHTDRAQTITYSSSSLFSTSCLPFSYNFID